MSWLLTDGMTVRTGQSATYSGITLKMSTVAGAAFITQVSGSIPFRKYIGRSITISDGSKVITGYVKAVGTVEGLSNELCSDPTFDNAGSWAPETGWSVAGGLGVGATASNYMLKQTNMLPTPSGKLYRLGFTLVSRTSGTVAARISSTASTAVQTVPASYSGYMTAGANGNAGVVGDATTGFHGTVDAFTAKQVTAPDSTGITIVSTRGGNVQSVASNTGILPNSATFTITIGK